MLDYKKINEMSLKDSFTNDFKDAYKKLKSEKEWKELVFLCVGTDRITGDCLGPIVGSNLIKLLENKNYGNINVYGSLGENINCNNIGNIIKRLDNNSAIVVIDAAVSNMENIGKIFVTNKKTILGKGLNKNKIEIGDVSVKCVVAKDYKIPAYNFKALQNTSLSTIMELANIVSDTIFEVIRFN